MSVEEVIATVKAAGLSAIEWRGIGHVPHGDLVTAKRVKALMLAAGLETSSYGSYYKVGSSEDDGLAFADVLATAVALGAPTIRVWAGTSDWHEVGKPTLDAIVADTLRIAALATQAGVTISFECHADTLTATKESTRLFAAMVRYPAVYFSWQASHGISFVEKLQGITELLPRLSTIHVYEWSIHPERLDWPAASDRYIRHPLSDGADQWRHYLAAAANSGRDHYVLLEFVKNDSPQQLIEDANVLRTLLN
jgi:3-dehydroshikimate dehydratase